MQKQFVIQSAAHLEFIPYHLSLRWSTKVYNYYLANIIDVAVFNKKENWLPTHTVIVRQLHNYGQLLPHDGMLVIPHHALSAHEMQNLVSDEIYKIISTMQNNKNITIHSAIHFIYQDLKLIPNEKSFNVT